MSRRMVPVWTRFSVKLLIRDIDALVLMDEARTVLRGGFLYCEDGEILQIGTRPPAALRPDRTIRASTCVAVPGFISMGQPAAAH